MIKYIVRRIFVGLFMRKRARNIRGIIWKRILQAA